MEKVDTTDDASAEAELEDNGDHDETRKEDCIAKLDTPRIYILVIDFTIRSGKRYSRIRTYKTWHVFASMRSQRS